MIEKRTGLPQVDVILVNAVNAERRRETLHSKTKTVWVTERTSTHLVGHAGECNISAVPFGKSGKAAGLRDGHFRNTTAQAEIG